MQHSEAIEMMAAEKYVLQEMSLEERDAFEEHFFGCPECALDVRLADAFVEHSKIVFSTPDTQTVISPVKEKPESWFSWIWRPAFLAPVMAGLLLAVGYQSFVTVPQMDRAIASANAPKVIPQLFLAVGAGRAKTQTVVAKPGEPVLASLDIRTSGYSSYVCELYSQNNELVWSLPISAEVAQKGGVPLLIPAAQLKPGKYSIAVKGLKDGSNQPEEIGSDRPTIDLQIQQ